MKPQLPIPNFFIPALAEGVWRVPYSTRSEWAIEWRKKHNIPSASEDRTRICLMPIDVQNTFCQPDFELYVGGRSGRGAIDDSVRLAEFVYRNLPYITEIAPTLDTHTTMQIFHPIFWVDADGNYPVGNQTIISPTDVDSGKWSVNPAIASSLSCGSYIELQQHALHYVRTLSSGGKYPLMIWAYHAMLGGIGHALTSILEEAFFFHGVARQSRTNFQIKGENPLTENYSVLRPEVLDTAGGRAIARKNTELINKLLAFDAVIIAGQAKSHCVAWTIADLLNEINAKDPELAKKVYLVEDCTSSVVIPEIVDFTDQGNEMFETFRKAGMHIVQSTDPIESWPGIRL